MRDADIAMYRAKGQGRAQYAMFDSALHAEVSSQLWLESALRRAIEQEQLYLAYQPIFDLRTRQMTAVEALCALGAPGARRDRAISLHPRRRGVGPHRAARGLGARAVVPPARVVAEVGAERRAPPGPRQRVRRAAPAKRLRRSRPAHRGSCAGASRAGLDRSDGKHVDRRVVDRAAEPAPATRRRAAHQHRRLRDRLLVVLEHVRPAHRRDQDRPLVRHAHDARQRRRGSRARDHRHGPRNGQDASSPKVSRPSCNRASCSSSAATAARAICSRAP